MALSSKASILFFWLFIFIPTLFIVDYPFLWFLFIISLTILGSVRMYDSHKTRMALHEAPPRTRQEAIERTREMLERIQSMSTDGQLKPVIHLLHETLLILVRSQGLSLTRPEEVWLIEGFRDISRVGFAAVDNVLYGRYTPGALPLHQELDMYLTHFEKRVLKLTEDAEYEPLQGPG